MTRDSSKAHHHSGGRSQFVEIEYTENSTFGMHNYDTKNGRSYEIHSSHFTVPASSYRLD